MKNQTTAFFSMPLFKQTCKSNIILAVAILLVMCMMANVTNYAMSIMATDTKEGISEDVQKDLYSYLFVIASYNDFSGSSLSYDDFKNSGDRADYAKAFDMYNKANGEAGSSDSEASGANSKAGGANSKDGSAKDEAGSANSKAGGAKDEAREVLSVGGFEKIVNEIESSDIDANTYVTQFEYVYALSGEKGCFSGEALGLEEFMDVMLASVGMSTEDMNKMKSIDFTVFFNKIYFTVIGMLPGFIFVIVVAYMLIAGQVDKGSMAYVLSTPTRRSAVGITQAIYLILAPLVLMMIVCAVRCASTVLFFGEVEVRRIMILYLGMYLVVEAAAGICYMFSCIFNQSSKALGLGGGMTVWFFLASLLGMFGSQDLVDMGVGSEMLNIFNKLTIISLFDASAVQTIGTSNVDTGFIGGMVILAVLAVSTYTIGAVRFCKKDLPL